MKMIDAVAADMIKEKVAWTNPNPDANYSAKTESMDLSDAKSVKILYRFNVTSEADKYEIKEIEVGKSSYVTSFGSTTDANLGAISRNTTVAANGITFGDCYWKYANSASKGSKANDSLIPIKVTKVICISGGGQAS